MRHFSALFLTLGLCWPAFANTEVDCQELLASQADSALLRKLEIGMVGEWNLAVPRSDGRPTLVSVLREPSLGKWILAQDERIALFAQQELLRTADHRVFRIDVRGPLDTSAVLEIFSKFLTAYLGRYVEMSETADELSRLYKAGPGPGDPHVLIVWTFEPYTEVAGDRSALWFNTLSALGTRHEWKQIVVSDDEALLKRLGMTNTLRGTLPWRPARP